MSDKHTIKTIFEKIPLKVEYHFETGSYGEIDAGEQFVVVDAVWLKDIDILNLMPDPPEKLEEHIWYEVITKSER